MQQTWLTLSHIFEEYFNTTDRTEQDTQAGIFTEYFSATDRAEQDTLSYTFKE